MKNKNRDKSNRTLKEIARITFSVKLDEISIKTLSF